MISTQRRTPICSAAWALLYVSFGILAFSGCERKERVDDIQKPAGDVQVDRNIDTGDVEVTDKD
jgi:hypothetical protein